MKLTTQQVEHIARLARLALTDQEKEKYATELTMILDYVDQLEKVDTKNIEPIRQITGLFSVWQEDRIDECQSREKLLACSPESEAGQVRVPAVFQ